MTWPETEIGQVASVPCPCGVSDPLIQLLMGTRRCSGTFEVGGVWEDPQCDSCQFSSTRLALCQLAQVGGLIGGGCSWFGLVSRSCDTEVKLLAFIKGYLQGIQSNLLIYRRVCNVHRIRNRERA